MPNSSNVRKKKILLAATVPRSLTSYRYALYWNDKSLKIKI
jgi:hypothetical protein